MRTDIYQVDAFTSEPFKGNPAAVCLPDGPRSDGWMQAVAAENNLSETAFLQREGEAFALRWFTPTCEVPLCGHATLASAHVLWETGRLGAHETARFRTRSGLLTARRADHGITIDLPASPLEAARPPRAALDALGVAPRHCARTPDRGLDDVDFLLELASDEDVRAVRPDFRRLLDALHAGVIVTARAASGDCDFVSRYFAPHCGIDEDPVTGAAHCALGPYWCERLGKTDLVGYQASARGGYVRLVVAQDRVRLTGEAVTVLQGVLLA
jgi:PhzF family phenazine biosynthesis protein